jgi:hypothetical protein
LKIRTTKKEETICVKKKAGRKKKKKKNKKQNSKKSTKKVRFLVRSMNYSSRKTEDDISFLDQVVIPSHLVTRSKLTRQEKRKEKT